MFATKARHGTRITSRVFVKRQSTVATPLRETRSRASTIAGVGIAFFGLGWYASHTTHAKDEVKQSAQTTPSLQESPGPSPYAGYPFGFLSPPTPVDVTGRLTKDTWSVSNPGVEGVSGYDGSRLACNEPCEDRYIHGTFPSPLQPGTSWMTWGVFDGHLGSQTSQALTQHLVPYVHAFLSKVNRPSIDDDVIHKAIKAAFVDLDKAFVLQAQETMDNGDLPFSAKVQRLATASNGSCALLSLFDPTSRKLHVACTGDSRAVLGRQSDDGKWETVPLSIDQGGSNEAEAERIAREHPGEEGIVKDGRVFGLATARAFGDAHWKWPLELQTYARERFVADVTRANKPEIYKTPPYITAEPEVTTTVLPPGKRAFMIMASDGLWDSMTSEQAVEMVARWLEWKSSGKPAVPTPPPKGEKWDKFDWAPYYSTGWKVVDETVTVQDGNAAVHLTRNALGGAHQDLVSALLSFKPPYARWVRDDITVQVVFFD